MSRSKDKHAAQQRADSTELLVNDTAVYFQALSGNAAAEESCLESAVAQTADGINIDNQTRPSVISVSQKISHRAHRDAQ